MAELVCALAAKSENEWGPSRHAAAPNRRQEMPATMRTDEVRTRSSATLPDCDHKRSVRCAASYVRTKTVDGCEYRGSHHTVPSRREWRATVTSFAFLASNSAAKAREFLVQSRNRESIRLYAFEPNAVTATRYSQPGIRSSARSFPDGEKVFRCIVYDPTPRCG